MRNLHTDKGYSRLALAIINRAVKDKDIEFVKSDWGWNLIELAKRVAPINHSVVEEYMNLCRSDLIFNPTIDDVIM